VLELTLPLIVISWRLRITGTHIFFNSSWGGGICQSYAPTASPLGKELPAIIQPEAGRAAEGVWEKRRREKYLSLPGINVIQVRYLIEYVKNLIQSPLVQQALTTHIGWTTEWSIAASLGIPTFEREVHFSVWPANRFSLIRSVLHTLQRNTGTCLCSNFNTSSQICQWQILYFKPWHIRRLRAHQAPIPPPHPLCHDTIFCTGF
jgi:hypothetical protein